MNTITLTVSKTDVYDEVAKTTSYTGAKMQGDDSAYNRIFTTDADKAMLERFWVEASNAATEQFKPYISSLTAQPEGHSSNLATQYSVTLNLSSSFDTVLQGSMETSLFSYFVCFIVSKWYKFTNKAEAETYAADAASMMEDVIRKMYYRMKPTRVAPTTT